MQVKQCQADAYQVCQLQALRPRGQVHLWVADRQLAAVFPGLQLAELVAFSTLQALSCKPPTTAWSQHVSCSAERARTAHLSAAGWQAATPSVPRPAAGTPNRLLHGTVRCTMCLGVSMQQQLSLPEGSRLAAFHIQCPQTWS